MTKKTHLSNDPTGGQPEESQTPRKRDMKDAAEDVFKFGAELIKDPGKTVSDAGKKGAQAVMDAGRQTAKNVTDAAAREVKAAVKRGTEVAGEEAIRKMTRRGIDEAAKHAPELAAGAVGLAANAVLPGSGIVAGAVTKVVVDYAAKNEKVRQAAEEAAIKGARQVISKGEAEVEKAIAKRKTGAKLPKQKPTAPAKSKTKPASAGKSTGKSTPKRKPTTKPKSSKE